MAGYQFARLETFSRKGGQTHRSISDICAEFGRHPGSHPHVENPKPPNLISGIDPSEIPDEIERRAQERRRSLRRSGIKPPRQDTRMLEGGVFSHPTPVADLDDPDIQAAYESWRDDTIEWARAEMQARGVEILSVIEHTDERYPHIHVLGVPTVETTPRLDAKMTHPGEAAAAAARSAGERPGVAYAQAMRSWQNDYHQNVSLHHGQARLGPQRRRLTRDAWRAEQSQAEAIANAQSLARQTHVDIQEKKHAAETRAFIIKSQYQAVANKRLAYADAQAQRTLDEAEDRLKYVADREQRVESREKEAIAIGYAIESFAAGRVTDALISDGEKRWQFAPDVTETEKDIFVDETKPAHEKVWSWVRGAAQSLRERWETIFKREQSLYQREAALEQRESAVKEIEDLDIYLDQARELRDDAENAPLRPRM